MAEDMTVQFTPTPQDYVKTYRTLQFRSTFTRITYGVLGLFELCLLASILIPGLDTGGRLWPIAVAIVIFIVLAVLWPSYSIGRRAKGNEQLLAPTTWEFNDAQLHISNRFADVKYEWAFFAGLIENKEYFFLRHASNKRLYNFLPKRAFTSTEQAQAFRETVNRNIMAGKKPAISSAANT